MLLTMKTVFLVLLKAYSVDATFQVAPPPALLGKFSRRVSLLNMNTVKQQRQEHRRLATFGRVLKNWFPQRNEQASFDTLVRSKFPGAISNAELEQKVATILKERGFTSSNTLLATSFCCDEVARRLEDAFVKDFGNDFHLGGLAGFPFAGTTGFGAMTAHIPDDGYCFIIYGPHVGISRDGTIGKVEREGKEQLDNCCGSAIAASNYLQQIRSSSSQGNNVSTMTKEQQFSSSDFQQQAVQELLLPYGKRLDDADDDRMYELPYCLYETQDLLMNDSIVDKMMESSKDGIQFALLGGIQINTGPDTPDYFHPLRFDYINSDNVRENMLSKLNKEGLRP